MNTSAQLLGFTVLAILVGGPGATVGNAATLPKDPCALLKPADIQALAPDAKIGSGKSTVDPGGFVVGYTYEWGPRGQKWGISSLGISVTDASKVWPGGLGPDDVKQRVLVMVQMSGPDAAPIPGIGDGAVFTAEPKSHDATAASYCQVLWIGHT